MVYRIETEREADGRWIAEVPELPGVMAYGSSEEEAIATAEALALRVLADRIEEQKEPASTLTVAVPSKS
ncbi:MAG: type II toxin-antitoxin system HicB family antitoxin [Acidobacteriota bacterium]|jgi:predicted RNase H-like HicB family nuclease|nr:type II toxin-antitoxin system HicB family antitoxin [Acidobacteriota bacterium]